MVKLKKYLTTKLDLSTSISIITIFVMLLSLPLISSLVKTDQDMTKLNTVTATGQSSSLNISVSNNQALNTPFDALILLNTDSAPVKGVDVVIDYDPSYLELLDIDPVAKETTSLKTFTPIATSGIFNREAVVSAGKETKKIRFSAVTYDYLGKKNTDPFNGVTQLAVLKFKPIKTGSTLVSFEFYPNNTKETNLVPASNPPYDYLSQSDQLLSGQIAILSPTTVPLQEPTVEAPSEDTR